MNRHLIRFGVVAAALLPAWACGGDAGDPDEPDSEPVGEVAPERLSIDQPVDAELASRGEELFRNKGCVACHSIGGGRLVGPDLHDVTERRELAWIERMIVNPDSMLRNDPTARELLAEYFTPMTNMGVQPREARALIHFLRREAEAASGS